MKKIGILAVSFVLAMLVGFSAVSALAEEQKYTVTYSINAFSSVTRSVTAGEKAEELSVADLHSGIGRTDIATLATDGLLTEWFTDAAFTQRYSFDSAVTGDLTLYGKVTENMRLGECDVFGWNTLSGVTYVGEAIYNRAITGEYVSFPLSVSEADGTAEFSFVGGGYSVFYRGFDIEKPFSVTMDIGNIEEIYQVTICNLSLYSSLTLAQAGTVYGHQNGGALGHLRFWVDGTNAGKIENTQSSWEPSPETSWSDTQGYGEPVSPFMQDYLAKNEVVTFTFYIGEESSEVYVGETKVVDLACKKSDFSGGRAFISVGSETGADMKVSVSQTMRTPAAVTEDDSVKVTSLTASNGYLVAEATVAEGCNLKASIEGAEMIVQKLSDGKYAVAVPDMLTDNFNVVFTAEKAESSKKGCSSVAGAVFLPVAATLCLAAVLLTGKTSKNKGVGAK